MSIKIFIFLLYQLQSLRTYETKNIKDTELLKPPVIQTSCGKIVGENVKIGPTSLELYPITQENDDEKIEIK